MRRDIASLERKKMSAFSANAEQVRSKPTNARDCGVTSVIEFEIAELIGSIVFFTHKGDDPLSDIWHQPGGN